MNPWLINIFHIYQKFYFFFNSYLIIPYFLLGPVNDYSGIPTWDSYMGRRYIYCITLICNVGNEEFTETVNRNANYSFLELVRQNMRLKLQQWYINYAFFFFFFFFFVICSQSLSKLRVEQFYMLIKTKSPNEQMILKNHIHLLPSRKSKNVLMWWVNMKWPNRPTWYYCSHM